MPEQLPDPHVHFVAYTGTGEILYSGHDRVTNLPNHEGLVPDGASFMATSRLLLWENDWIDGGLEAERPSLEISAAGAAPFNIDLSFLPSPATLRNEAGDTVQCQGPETLVDPGTYWIEPPFPWRSQVVVLS